MKIELRPWQIDDLDSLIENGNNFEVARFMTDVFPHPYTEEAARRFIDLATTEKPKRLKAIAVDGMAVGGIGIHPKTDVLKKNAELGYWLGQAYWGKGIASQVVPQMVKFAFETYDITRLYACVYGNNKASQRVLEKCGFKLEAHFDKTIFKNGEFLDELIYAVRKV